MPHGAAVKGNGVGSATAAVAQAVTAGRDRHSKGDDMGNWNINIQGIGAHHNTNPEYPKDANKMAAAFVQQLRDAGHVVESASFTHGGKEDLVPPASSDSK